MNYIERIDNKVVCTHPKVTEIHEWGSIGISSSSLAVNCLTIKMIDGEKQDFSDSQNSTCIELANIYLKNK